ncbi:MAG TPA: CTP synthase [bacterium]|nr:CTP synthase [bacterium]
MSKYIFVSGSVISGVGKGITAASIGSLLRAYGFKVSILKSDPYLNIDAGTMNPLEHGETFVLEDGLETDMDLGHYERFTSETFTSKNYMTLGLVLNTVLENERQLKYKGKCVQIYKHPPEEIIRRIKEAGSYMSADIVIVEIGGTIGEYEAELFLEANRLMKYENPNDVIHINVSYLPIPAKLGEMKTKPTQIAIRTLNRWVNPDFIIGRAAKPMDQSRKEKISYFCNVPVEHVISAPDVKNVYEIPLNFEKANLTKNILKSLNLKSRRRKLYSEWEEKIEKIKKPKKEINIGLVAKYIKSGDFDLEDSYVSVVEAIKHAAWESNLKPKLHWFASDNFTNDRRAQNELKRMDAIIVPQGWGSRGVEGKIKAVQIARENRIPYLGLCFGMQMAVIEYARNVLRLKDANSEEVNPKSSNLVVHLMEEQKKILKEGKFGGTIRLGAWPCKVKSESLLEEAYKKYANSIFPDSALVQERHRHRYEFNNDYRDELESAGLVLSGTSPDGSLVEAIELPRSVHPFFVGTQYHPELKSRFLDPHPLFMALIEVASGD